VIDFTSSLYLGLRHGSGELGPWDQLTTGAPAALHVPPGEPEVARDIGLLMGLERSVVMRSTLHAFFDLFSLLRGGRIHVLIDSAAYPVAVSGATVARAAGAPITPFGHHDVESLQARLENVRGRPIIVTDGFCPGCRAAAPIDHYIAITAGSNALVVLDDTQAFGLLGRDPSAASPYGSGGGGTLRWLGVRSRRVVVVASLAKALGAPVAVVVGPNNILRMLDDLGTRVHSSPPTVVDLHAAKNGLEANAASGDARRARLLGLIRRLQARLSRGPARPVGGIFPVQGVRTQHLAAPLEVQRSLLERGVAAVVHHARCRPHPTLSLIITATHRPSQIDKAASVLSDVLAAHQPRRGAAS